jgi:hypothetical protein
MPARIDRTGQIVKQAVEAAQQSGAATVSSGSGTGSGSFAPASIQDESGNLYLMWDISSWDGNDVFAP